VREDTIHRGRDAVHQGGREDAASQQGRMLFVDEGGHRLSKTSWMMWGEGRKEEQRISVLGNSKFNINNHMMSEFQWTSMNCVSRLEVVHSPVTLLSQKAWHSRWAYTIVGSTMQSSKYKFHNGKLRKRLNNFRAS